MKKIVLLVLTALAFSGCSDDSEESTNNNNNNTEYVSTLEIGTQEFLPENTIVTAATVLSTGVNDGTWNMRLFTITQGDDTQEVNNSIQAAVYYPALQASINGTYEFGTVLEGMNTTAGFYSEGPDMASFISGSVTVSDLGNNKYKLVFNDVEGQYGGNAANITISGSFEAEFISQ